MSGPLYWAAYTVVTGGIILFSGWSIANSFRAVKRRDLCGEGVFFHARRHKFAKRGTGYTYGPYEIWPMVFPNRNDEIDWRWCHREYDPLNSNDHSCGRGATLELCIRDIHYYEEDKLNNR